MKNHYLSILILLAGLQISTFSISTPPTAAVVKTEVEQTQLSLDAPHLLQRGKELYRSQQFDEAVKVLEAAAQAFKTEGDRLNQALALNYLSLAYLHLGQLQKANSASQESLTLLKSIASNSKDYLSILAQTYNTTGQLQLALGQTEEALASWEQATNAYTKIGNDAGIIGSQINQAQALQSLGQYRRALTMLNNIDKTIQDRPDSLIKAKCLLSMGNALRVLGYLDQKDSHSSQQVLERALTMAKQIKSPEADEIVAEIQLSLGNSAEIVAENKLNLGNTDQSQSNIKEALNFYQKVATIPSASLLTQIQAKLNQLHLLIEAKQWSDAQNLLPSIQSELAALPLSRETVYDRINFAENLTRLKETRANSPSWDEIAQLVATSIRDAETLGDRRAEAYANGTLGGVYEQTQQWQKAQKWTQKAWYIAQGMGVEGMDIAYRWQWQLGRILKAPGNPQSNTDGAIAAYSQALQTLASLRNDLVALHRDVQFSFREQVEPIYRQQVDLLLSSENPTQDRLKQARQTIESLQLAELDNFFRDACLQAKPEQIDQIVDRSDSPTAAIYPIILPNKLAVIVKLPNTQDLQYYSTTINSDNVEKILNDLLQELKRDYPSPDGKQLSNQLYGWLLRHVETQLKDKGVKNIVFVLDGSLRNIPMAALYDDNKQYLIRNYGVTIAPGLQLLTPHVLTEKKIKVLVAGVSVQQTIDNKEYPEIYNVNSEITQISDQVKSNVTLKNQDFTVPNFQNQINSANFTVVHIATHGVFGSTPEQTYIVAWGQLIRATDLDNILRVSDQGSSNNIELLVLTACETAKGDRRATLGLAGLAVRAGARSTLASLWRVDDASSPTLVAEFYKQLQHNPKITKAEALRQAQIKLLSQPETEAPYKWAPYILVGNWQ